jgi:Holliday junction resolvase RusA-like endonuclease
MTSHSIFIEMKPIPKGRPRMTRRGRVFTPQTTIDAETIVREAWTGPCYEGDVSLVCQFTKENVTLTVSEISEGTLTKSTLRGDIDNYVKLLMDGLNGVAWQDDKQVKLLIATKE